MTTKAEFWRDTLREAAAGLKSPLRLMEVCGSHSLAVARSGLRALLPDGVKLLSGPGCPVCVSSASFIDRAIQLARQGVRVALFGDLLKIPGSHGSLAGEPGLLVIYSPEEALEFARAHASEETVLAAVGFEPTAAVGAAVLEAAERENLKNFSLLADFKHLRPALELLAGDAECRPDGFLLPGHVASIVGEAGFRNLPLPGVISGFGAENILHSLKLLLAAIAQGDTRPVNNYPQLVAPEGNRVALALIDECFEAADSEWRGIGRLPKGGWKVAERFAAFDAVRKYQLPEEKTATASPCRCGDVLRGRILPSECPLFGSLCTPEHPEGPCMVSAEGACAALWNYREAV